MVDVLLLEFEEAECLLVVILLVCSVLVGLLEVLGVVVVVFGVVFCFGLLHRSSNIVRDLDSFLPDYLEHAIE